MKLSNFHKSEGQRYFDEDLETGTFNITEIDLTKCAFSRLGHTKVKSIKIQKKEVFQKPLNF